jgi:hypothetical protein
MNNRERFRRTLLYGPVDRPPYIEQEIRAEVISAWRTQGLDSESALFRSFPVDRLVEIELNLDPLPEPQVWPETPSDLDTFREALDPRDPARLPDGWSELVRLSRSCDDVFILKVHHGLFLSMGVDGWQRFEAVMNLLNDDPGFVARAMETKGKFAARLAEQALQELKVDAAVFSEPIGGNHGPLISPRTYEEFVLKSYDPLLEVLRRNGVGLVIFRTWGNARLLLPAVVRHGFNCLWAWEANNPAMDYRDLRREFGRELGFIGGIDLDALRGSQDSIRREILEKVPALLASGGYIPGADGRIREDVPYENYLYYRRLLGKVTSRHGTSKGGA